MGPAKEHACLLENGQELYPSVKVSTFNTLRLSVSLSKSTPYLIKFCLFGNRKYFIIKLHLIELITVINLMKESHLCSVIKIICSANRGYEEVIEN